MTRRVRRSPEAARAHILETAARRLQQFGVKGLSIKEVAADAGINHGTVLHHFGNADGMREALLQSMTGDLIDQMSAIMDSGAPTDELIVALFELLSSSG